jgi:hypothetical protein
VSPSRSCGAIPYWIATTEDEVHFVDAILSAYDGLATVRREFKLKDGSAMYKIYVAAGMEAEFLEVMDRLKTRAVIGAVIRGDENAPASCE